VLYRLCGLGPKCAIAGKPSTERHLLLRREALELALYTFHYVGDVDQVVVFMPPAYSSAASTKQTISEALLFRPGDVEAELHRPLRSTLDRRTPSVAGVAESPDSGLVDRLTTSTLYTFSLTPANQDARVFLVMDPLPAAPATQPQPAAPSGSGSASGGGAAKKKSGSGSGSKSGSSGRAGTKRPHSAPKGSSKGATTP
jgi:hypothetical protein